MNTAHQIILYLPILTTIFSIFFTIILFRHFRARNYSPHLGWWTLGVFFYGVGTFTEGFTALFGWSEWVFRAWYISGALLGGFPLAQGTVYLLLSRKTANRLSMIYVPFIIFAAICVLLTPLHFDLVEPHRLSGNVIVWHWVRLFSPFINIYAFIFLVGGAILSAIRYKKVRDTYYRFLGNVYIAVGALLPGIGGTFTRFGYTEVLYVTELIGLVCIFIGYYYNVRTRPLINPAAVQKQGEVLSSS